MKSESRREEKHSFVTCFLGAMDSHKIILYFSGKVFNNMEGKIWISTLKYSKLQRNLFDFSKFALMIIYHSSEIYFSQVL